MRCPFCGANPISSQISYEIIDGKSKPQRFCFRCNAGDGGLTPGQMEVLRDLLRESGREEIIFPVFVALMLGVGIFTVVAHLGAWIAAPFALLVIVLVFGVRQALYARDIRWLLTWWGTRQG